MNSAEYFEKSKKLSPGGVQSPVRSFKSVGGTPVYFKSAKGPFLYDVEGKEYVDFCMSFGPMILGHRDPDVEAVVNETVKTAWSFGTAEPYSLELAEFMVTEIPWVEKVRFVSSGTEAVMSALRLARAFTGRDKVLKFDGCYHGHVDSLLVKAGSGLAGTSSSDSAGIGEVQASQTLVLPLDDENAVKEVFAAHGKDIACLIVEPLPANYGLLPQRKEYIEKIADMARANGSLVIFDEVISGFRVGMQGMAAKFDKKPDLVTYGKIIGGGFPVGAYGGRKDLMEMIAPEGPVYQAGTLSGNPFGMRAGLATLQKLKRDNVHAKLEKNTARFAEEMKGILNGSGRWSAVYQESLFWFHGETAEPVRRVDKIPAGHAEAYAKLFHALLNEGVYLAPSGYEVGFFSNAHDEKTIERVLEAASRAVKAVAKQ